MIYDKFFGLKEEPFGVTPDPKYLYLSKQHEDALAHLNFGIAETRGFIMLTGEIGSGKTTLIRYLLDHLEAEAHSSLIVNPMVDPLELLKLINHDFGVVAKDNSHKEQLEALNAFLLNAYSKNKKAVLVIDEAQELSIESLEFIRLLSNLETDKKKLLQVILVGQPELRKIVATEPLRQLDQRIAVRYHLSPLDFSGTVMYINHRLKVAGGGMVAFPSKGIKLIYEYSRGIPRLINLVCDRTLLLAYSEGKIKIDRGMVKKAINDLGPPGKIRADGRLKLFFAGAFAFILMLTLAYSNLSDEKNFFEKGNKVPFNVKTDIKAEAKAEAKAETEIFISNDGVFMASKEVFSEAACVLNLLNIWREKGLPADKDAAAELKKRGYSVYKIGNDLKKAVKFSLPVILHMKDNNINRCAVLRWVVGNDAMLIDPMEGKNILPMDNFKNLITDIILVYKNKYNSDNNISLLQKELKNIKLYNSRITGKMGPKTKDALKKFQTMKGLKKTGLLDEETKIMLSSLEGTPRLIPE